MRCRVGQHIGCRPGRTYRSRNSKILPGAASGSKKGQRLSRQGRWGADDFNAIVALYSPSRRRRQTHGRSPSVSAQRDQEEYWMNEQVPENRAEAAQPSPKEEPKSGVPLSARAPSIIVGLIVVAVAGLSIWYLVRPQPLLVQGEVDATRLDIAARVDGRVAEVPVVRGQNVGAEAVLVRIDNPETIAKHAQALAANVVAEAQLANINVGTRAEVIAARKAAYERTQSNVVLAQKTFERVRQLAEHGNAPQARLDQVTDALHESERAMDQAKSAYEQAVNGYTKEEHQIAEANVQKAIADITAVQSIIDQMVIYAPVASQVYKRNVEPGEYVSPGVPLITLIDL